VTPIRLAAKVFFAPFPALLCLLTILLTDGCTTKKNTWVTRHFHNTTSRFNGYFYANESVKDGLFKLETTRKEDYSKILPVFIYPNPEQAKALFPEMDKSILKLSKVIKHHMITTKSGKEIPGACKWIAPSFVLMGRAHFYKRDFFAAIENFDYVSRTYKKNNDRSLALRWFIRNPEDTRYPLLSDRYMGMMWLIRAYDEMGSVSEAESLIDLLADDKELPKEYQSELAAIEAYHFLMRENYGGAMKPLLKAITLCKSRKYRARYTFILAQLEQKTGKLKRASDLYTNVVKLHPVYEMAFNAQMNKASCYDPASPEEGEKIKKQLFKMLKDKKNIDLQDQIYYALAVIAEKDNQMNDCMSYLKRSIKKSVSNKNQKALSFLKLADISFDRMEYRPAQAYYDSTVSLIKPDFPNFELINNKRKSLSDLVRNMTIIIDQDSLQAIARMSDAARDAKIAEVMADEEAAQKKKEEELALQKQQQKDNSQMGQQAGGSQQNNGQWYYYNSATVNFGMSDFKKKWGDRKLEDNWRRSSKDATLDDAGASSDQTDAAADSTKKTAVVKKTTDKKSKDFYLQNIPLTEAALKKSNEKILEAYYALGSIYKEQLFNNKKAAETFEDMLQRFPENKYKLITYYQLYRLYLLLANQDRTDYFKNLILDKYPDTEYAKIIRNPGYNASKESNLSAAEAMYNATFQLYRDSNYLAVIAKCQEADTALGKNPLLPRFDMLNALAIGHTQGVDAFEAALTRILIKHPKGEIKDKAQEYLDLIKKKRNAEKNGPETKKDTLVKTAVQYLFDASAQYLFAFIYEGTTDINKLKIQLADINSEFYSLADLKVDYIPMDNDRHLLTVKSFEGKEKAMTYYSLITKDKKDIFTGLNPAKLNTFVISNDNFPIFYKEKNIGDYVAFFQEKFLK